MATKRLVAAVSSATKPSLPIKSVVDIPQRLPKPWASGATRRPRYDRTKRQLPSASLDTPTRLKVLFSQPSTSTSPAPIDETTLLAIVRPVFEADKSRLDAFLYDISASLSPEKYKPTTRTPEVESVINDILAHCWIRSNELNGASKSTNPPFTSVQSTDIGRNYARRMVRLAVDGSDAAPLLAHFEGTLRQYKSLNFMLAPPLFAAWAVLRHEAGEKEFTIQFIPVRRDPVFKALHSLLGTQDQEFDRYARAVEQLLAEVTGRSEELPDTPEDLDRMLGLMRIGQQTSEVVGLWGKYKEAIRAEKRGEAGTALSQGENVRIRCLASFLRFFLRSPAYRRLPAEERELAVYRDEVLSFLPRPYPAAIHHALLVHRARIDDERDTSDVRELDEEVVEFRDKAQVVEDLEAVWKTAGEDGARDLKSYMLYMEGLAKIGDAQKLGMTWEELVRDQACKEAFHREEGAGKVFPPTRALNHMISCAFLIPNQGVEMAFELFNQAILPTSAIPCDIVTINTALRHHARRGVVDAMIALFPIAERHKLRPDVITYTVLLQGLLRAREIRLAAKTLETMYKQGIPPNERTISLLISDLAKYGDRKGLRTAENLMKEMKVLQMKVGEVPWTSLISGYFRGGWDDEAWDAIRRMEGGGVEFNRVGYNMVLRELGERVFSSTFPYTSQASSPSSTDMDTKSLLLRMFERMEGKVQPNSDTYLIVLTPLVRAQRWAEADQVVKEMKGRGFVAEKAALRVILKRITQRKRLWD